MNAVFNWIEDSLAAVPLPLLETWGRLAYYTGWIVMVLAFGGFTLRSGGRWRLGREHQTWDRKAVAVMPLTFLLITVTGYVGSFIVLVPGAQTFESLKDLVVFLCIVLFGYPALITVPFAYGLSDLIEGIPPEFIIDWLPGYFINPACFWVAYRFFGRDPDFRRGRTWLAYLGFVAVFMAIEPVMWGYICADKFTPDISFRAITPALFLTMTVTWLLAPPALLACYPLAKKLKFFWAGIRGHVRERTLFTREWVWESGGDHDTPALIKPETSMPILMLILTPFIALILLMVGATAYVTLRSAEDEANRLATRLHEEIAHNLRLYLDEQRDRPGQTTTAALSIFLRSLPIAAEGRVWITSADGQLIACSTTPSDPVIASATTALQKLPEVLRGQVAGQEFHFVQITSRPLNRETWLARVESYRDPTAASGHWLVVTAMPESYYLAGVRTGNARSAMIFVLALLLAIALAAVLASVVTAPLRRISKATLALARGDRVDQLPDTNLEELRVLTRSFNAMAGQLKDNFDSIHAEMARRQGAELQVRGLNRTYAMLSEINRLLVHKYQPAEVLTQACQIAIARGGFRLAWIGLINPVTGKLELVAHGGASPDTMDALRLVLSNPALGCDFTAQALRTGASATCDDVEKDPRSAPWRALALERGYRSLISLPLSEHGRTTGNFNLYAGEPFFFNRDEITLLNELAANIAFAREVAERERERVRAEVRNTRQRDSLITLTGQQHGSGEADLADSLRRITESSARALVVARVSVWRYTPDRTGIQAHSMFDLADGRHHALDTTLPATAYPAYFQALASGDVLAVDDVSADPRTSELSASYFQPHGIGALMDIPIYLSGAVAGVLCHEHVGPPRHWTADEKTFALAMANRVSLSIEASERIQAESALRTSEERFRELAGTVDDVFWINDPVNNAMLYVSPAYERIWGRTCQSLYESFRSWLDSVHPDDRERLLEIARNQLAIAEKFEEEFRIIRPDGSHRWIRARAYPVRDASGLATRIVGVARDTTERRQLEEQLHQAQKMEAIGQLAGGVAHDFNNILAAILMQTELLLRLPALPDKVTRGLDMIRQSSERAANLTRQLLLFSRKQVMQPRVLDINEGITRLSSMLNRIIGEDITLQLKLAPELLQARADESMIDQVVMNLVVNSRDAMPHGGQLLIETAAKVIDESMARLYTEAKPGRYVWICISDSGEGIPPHVITRIFEPFFTTKRPGKGTGLGLATVFGIVKQHQGWIRVYSEIGRGTSFQVFIPATAGAVQAETLAAPVAESLRGTETILLVEDDENVRNMTHSILEMNGYRVLSAPDGPSALATWQEHRDSIALLLTDLIMPGGLGGKELGQQLVAEKARLKIIYTSGYSSEMAGKELELRAGENFLQKPSSSELILRCVRTCLDS